MEENKHIKEIESLKFVDPNYIDEAPNDMAINNAKIIYNIIRQYYRGNYRFCATVDGGIGISVGNDFSIDCHNSGLIVAGYYKGPPEKVFVFYIDIGQTMQCECDPKDNYTCEACEIKTNKHLVFTYIT